MPLLRCARTYAHAEHMHAMYVRVTFTARVNSILITGKSSRKPTLRAPTLLRFFETLPVAPVTTTGHWRGEGLTCVRVKASSP
jgi:hypothetical protein